jgi:hypothetical protein
MFQIKVVHLNHLNAVCRVHVCMYVYYMATFLRHPVHCTKVFLPVLLGRIIA